VDDYGGLNTEMEDINVFDARNDMGDKIDSIQYLASVDVMTEDTCTDLLEELHTACREESCSRPNEYSSPLSVYDVCNAVNTTSKLKVKVMGDYYDFRNWIVPGGKPRNTVFVTSETYTGNLGGIFGADAKCQTLANNVKLPGTFKAWISTSPFGPSGLQQNGPFLSFKRSPYLDSLSYHLVDGGKIANDWADLTSGSLRRPINMDEKGSLIVNFQTVWTNTNVGGKSYSSDDCNGWTSSNGISRYGYGVTDQSNAAWTQNFATTSCQLPSRLYCFQQQEVSYCIDNSLCVSNLLTPNLLLLIRLNQKKLLRKLLLIPNMQFVVVRMTHPSLLSMMNCGHGKRLVVLLL